MEEMGAPPLTARRQAGSGEIEEEEGSRLGRVTAPMARFGIVVREKLVAEMSVPLQGKTRSLRGVAGSASCPKNAHVLWSQGQRVGRGITALEKVRPECPRACSDFEILHGLRRS